MKNNIGDEQKQKNEKIKNNITEEQKQKMGEYQKIKI